MPKKTQKTPEMRIYRPRKNWITKLNKPILPLNWGLTIRQYCRQGED